MMYISVFDFKVSLNFRDEDHMLLTQICFENIVVDFTQWNLLLLGPGKTNHLKHHFIILNNSYLNSTSRTFDPISKKKLEMVQNFFIRSNWNHQPNDNPSTNNKLIEVESIFDQIRRKIEAIY